MLNVGRITLLLITLSFSTAGLADDAEPSTASADTAPIGALSQEAINHEWNYSSRWRLSHPVEPMTYVKDWSQPTVNVTFQDSGALARISKLRSFSFLTFAEIGRTRLFLGVDDNGIVGLHMRAFHRVGDERYLEVVRMPYLEDDQPENDGQ